MPKFESFQPQKETKETLSEFKISKLNEAIQKSTESLNFLHSLVGNGKENAQDLLDKMRMKKDELLNKQKDAIQEKKDFKAYNEMEAEIKKIDKKIYEIFEITSQKDPEQITEEQFEEGLRKRQSLVIKNIEQNQSELAAAMREKEEKMS